MPNRPTRRIGCLIALLLFGCTPAAPGQDATAPPYAEIRATIRSFWPSGTPTPGVTPTPLPGIVGGPYRPQIESYRDRLRGKQVIGWTGWVVAIAPGAAA